MIFHVNGLEFELRVVLAWNKYYGKCKLMKYDFNIMFMLTINSGVKFVLIINE